MNIALSFAGREKQISGVNRLIYECTTQILAQDKKNRYYTADENWMHFPICTWNPVMQEISAGASPDLFLALNDVRLMHSFYAAIDTCALKNVYKVLTVHDLIPLVNNTWHNGNAVLKDYFATRIRRSVEEADCVCAVSEHTKSDIIKYYGTSADKIRVVYPGCYVSPETGADAANGGGVILRKLGLSKDEYILSVCTIEPRKNLRGLVSSFALFKAKYPDSRLKLVLCGKKGWDDTFEQFYFGLDGKIKEDVVLAGYVPDSELGILYENAFAFAYVSFYEGFGLPILEALRFGAAVICSETSSMPEVGGDAVIYCNPHNVESIADAMEKLAFDSRLKERLQQKASVQAAKFSYKKMAKDMINVYTMFA